MVEGGIIELDQHVHVTVRPGIPPGLRPKKPDTPDGKAMLYLLFALLQQGKQLLSCLHLRLVYASNGAL